ncbi:MAG: AMP-binding protein [Acidobacteria bacterium]|nr:AMP-binding protein [Acidobacteriota bacterium]
MSKSFCEQLIESFESRPNATAMRIVGSDEATYTWAEMHERIRSVSYRLRQEGVQFGDRVALIGENHPKWAIAYLGTLMIGAVIVPLDPHGELETITNFLVNSEAKVAFLSPDQTKHFAKVEEKLGRTIPKVVWNLDEDTAGFEHFEDWAATQFPAEFAAETPPARGEDMAVLMYTSGTTGTPKGVPLTHGNIIAELEGVNLVLKLSDKEKILSLLPLFHAYLQIVNMWIATKYGCEVGYLKELTPDELSKAMKEFKPTILTTVPRLWYLFHKKIFDGVKAKSGVLQRLLR